MGRFVLRKGGPHPHFFRGASPNLSRTKTLVSPKFLLDSLKSGVWGGARFLSLPIKVTGIHPHPQSVSALNNTLGRRRAGSPFIKPRREVGTDTPLCTSMIFLNGHLDVQPGTSYPSAPCHWCALPATAGGWLPVLVHPRSRNSSRVPGRSPQLTPTGKRLSTRHYLSPSSPSVMERTVSAAAGLQCSAAPRPPAEPAAAILRSSWQRPFQSAPLSRRGGPGPHLHRGLNRVKSQSSRTGRGKGKGRGRRRENEKQNRGKKDSGAG